MAAKLVGMVSAPTRAAAGLLLTGGASSRMGRDKATLPVGAETLARRTARLLGQVAQPALEIGPGVSGLPAALEQAPGSGPLAAVAQGGRVLADRGWSGPVIVVATDLPNLTRGLLDWLAGHPSESSVVPVDRGRVQPLCARYTMADLATAARLVAAGQRSMNALVDTIHPLRVGEDAWAGPAGDPGALADVDTPDELARARARRGRESAP